MSSTLPRYIPTRLLEACTREAKACYDDLGMAAQYGDRIYPYPLLPNQGIIARQINIGLIPPSYEEGVGGMSDTEYIVEFDYFFPIEAFAWPTGGNSYLDEILALRTWLFSGGTVKNKCPRIVDPDSETGGTINTEIKRFMWFPPTEAPGKAGVEVIVHVTFGTVEDRAGMRPA